MKLQSMSRDDENGPPGESVEVDIVPVQSNRNKTLKSVAFGVGDDLIDASEAGRVAQQRHMKHQTTAPMMLDPEPMVIMQIPASALASGQVPQL